MNGKELAKTLRNAAKWLDSYGDDVEGLHAEDESEVEIMLSPTLFAAKFAGQEVKFLAGVVGEPGVLTIFPRDFSRRVRVSCPSDLTGHDRPVTSTGD